MFHKPLAARHARPAKTRGAAETPKTAQTRMCGLLVWGFLLPSACTPAAFVSDAQNWTAASADLRFSACPSPIPEAVGNGPMWLQVAPEHLLCGEGSTNIESVLDVLASKMLFHLVEGDYFFPTTTGTYPLSLQFCALLQNDKMLSLDTSSPGELQVSEDTVLGENYLRYRYEHHLQDENDGSWHFIWRLEGYERDFEDGIRIDARPWNFATPKMDFRLCQGSACADSDDVRTMRICEQEDWRLEQHRFEYAAGSVEFDVLAEADVWPAQTQIVSARGQHNGEPFEVSDFWQLGVRLSSPWDNARDLIVRFDEPIGDVCGLVVEYAYPYPNASWGTVIFAVDCADELEELRLRSADWVSLEDDDEKPATEGGVGSDVP